MAGRGRSLHASVWRGPRIGSALNIFLTFAVGADTFSEQHELREAVRSWQGSARFYRHCDRERRWHAESLAGQWLRHDYADADCQDDGASAHGFSGSPSARRAGDLLWHGDDFPLSALL